MGKAEKALWRLLGKPKDFTWDELVSLMRHFGYEEKRIGGSSRKFVHSETKATLMMHEPHPAKVLKGYQVQAAIAFLKQEGYT